MVISLSKKNKTKGGLYNTYHELLSEKWIVKRSWFHVSYIISPQSVVIFATSHLVGCIEYWYNSLEAKVDKSTVATFNPVGWIDYTPQNILGQKFWQYKIQNAKTLQWKSNSEIYRPKSDWKLHWKLINLKKGDRRKNKISKQCSKFSSKTLIRHLVKI